MIFLTPTDFVWDNPSTAVLQPLIPSGPSSSKTMPDSEGISHMNSSLFKY